MAPNLKHLYNLGAQALAPIKNQQIFTRQVPSMQNSDSPFPILAIAVLSIMGTAFLLISYYIFVTKCCNNWDRLNLLRRFSILRARQNEGPFIAFSPTMWNRGLDESVIRDIPTCQFRREEGEDKNVYGCVVCLNDFQDQDMLRVLPNCGHAFHLDCIDIWLQSNANCPLCRKSISGSTRYPFDQIIAPRSSPQGSQQYADSLMGGDEDFVVIELGEDEDILFPYRQQEREHSSEVFVQPGSHSPKRPEKKIKNLKPKKGHHKSIMGDECIDLREKDDQFPIQPIRRSFSLDSAADRQLYLTAQAIVRQNGHHREVTTDEECSTRSQRSFLPLRHGRGSRNAVLPVEFEL
ncbi:RING-H2 finger protein ATL16-like [Mangifera indica]|uniref:RING-H2 finger protein ATL16-like n=1 Tax=Mangifera indica TaxID=29780 RepID=UPI001CFB2F3C|nr:RING-H2 finger protein ATL16-like [Mangifera indica]